MNINETKRRFRRLKALELEIKYGKNIPPRPALTWDIFFDLKNDPPKTARYGLAQLASMSAGECRGVIAEYLSYVYGGIFCAGTSGVNYNSEIFLEWGLPASADIKDIKKRFHELAMLCHPDIGGEAEEFIALMEEYRKLTGG